MGRTRGFRLFRKFRDRLAGRRGQALAEREPVPRERRLVLHVGGPKCGSSAIQAALAANNERLAARGVLVASDAMDAAQLITYGQVGYFRELGDRPTCVEELTHRFKALAVVMDDRAADTLILSAENLLLQPGAAAMVIPAARAAGFVAEVFAYVRRRDDFLIAAWQQWGVKTHASPEEFWKDFDFSGWLPALMSWEEQVGRQSLKVFPYRRDFFPDGDVTVHFMQVIGLHSPEMVRPAPANPSCNEHLTDLLNRVRDLFSGGHDNDVLDKLAQTIGPASFKAGSGSYFLTLEQRRAVLEQARADDEAVKARYLPQLGAAPLFPPLRPEQVVECSDIEKLRAENALLLRAIYSLNLRVSQIETATPAAPSWRRFLPKRRSGVRSVQPDR